MIVVEKEVFRLHLPVDEKKKLVKVQGCSHKRNARREYKRLETTERLLHLDSLQQEDKTGTITLRLVFWISLATDLARCNKKRRVVRSSKNRIDGVLSRIFIHSRCKARSHNPEGSCALREKKKRIPVFDHTYRKIPKISSGANIFQRPFLRGLFLEGLIFGGTYLWREICVSKSMGLAL